MGDPTTERVCKNQLVIVNLGPVSLSTYLTTQRWLRSNWCMCEPTWAGGHCKYQCQPWQEDSTTLMNWDSWAEIALHNFVHKFHFWVTKTRLLKDRWKYIHIFGYAHWGVHQYHCTKFSVRGWLEGQCMNTVISPQDTSSLRKFLQCLDAPGFVMSRPSLALCFQLPL